MNNASWLWARSQWRRSRVPLALCAAVLAITGSLSLGAATAANRAASAMDRLQEQTNAADLVLDAPTAEGVDAVSAVATNVYFIQRRGVDEAIGSGFYAATQRQLLDLPANVPILLDGRRSDPDVPNEIEVSERFADLHDLAPGDVVTFESMTFADLDAWFSGRSTGRPAGPPLDLRIAGVVLAPADFSNPAGTIFLTEAFDTEYADIIAHFEFLNVRVSDPATAQALLAAGELGDVGVSATEWSATSEVDGGLQVVAFGLRLFAVTVAVSGLAVFWILAKRLGRSFQPETRAMSTMGLDRLGVVRSGALLLLPAVTCGIATALIAAPFVATRLRLGLAGDVEPNRGLHIDLGLMLLGGLGLMVTTAAMAAVSLDERRRSAPSVAPAGVSWLSVRQPVALTVATRDALRRGDRLMPSRALLLSAVTVSAAAVASISLGFSVGALDDTPRAWGDGGDVSIGFGDSTMGARSPYEESLDELTGDDRIRDLNGWVLFEASLGGPTTKGVAIDTRQGAPILTVLSGRSPRTANEVALGTATLELLDHHLGDDVQITIGRATETFEVVGTVAFPDGDMEFDDGIAITEPGGRRFPGLENDWLLFYTMLTWADGVDQGQAADELIAAGFDVVQQPVPPAVENLGQVGDLPNVLAGFFVLLAVSAIAYSVGLSSRAGRPRAAVLVALGLTPRTCRSMIGLHATVLGTLATVVAVPIGLIAGRLLWSAVTGQIGILPIHADPTVFAYSAITIGLAGSVVIGAAFVIGTRRRPLHLAIRTD